MMKKILAIAFLSLALTACESTSTENGNVNAGAKPAATPIATATPEASPAAPAQIKPGDKVKVTINGTTSEATVVSIDEKVGKVTVRITGQKEDKTVAVSDIVKQ